MLTKGFLSIGLSLGLTALAADVAFTGVNGLQIRSNRVSASLSPDQKRKMRRTNQLKHHKKRHRKAISHRQIKWNLMKLAKASDALPGLRRMALGFEAMEDHEVLALVVTLIKVNNAAFAEQFLTAAKRFLDLQTQGWVWEICAVALRNSGSLRIARESRNDVQARLMDHRWIRKEVREIESRSGN